METDSERTQSPERDAAAAAYELEPDTEVSDIQEGADELPFAPPQLHKRAVRLRPIVESFRARPAAEATSPRLRYAASSRRTRGLTSRISARSKKEVRLGWYELRETWNDLARIARTWRWRRQGVRVGQDALARYRDLGDHRREALKLNALARIYRARGECQEAIVCCTQALTLFRRLRNRRGECLSLSNLGLAHEAQGNRVMAVRCYEEALNMAQQLGDAQIEGQVLANLGTAYNRQGRRSEARRLWEQALGMLTPGTSAHRDLSRHLG